jgi:hypothetical protein
MKNKNCPAMKKGDWNGLIFCRFLRYKISTLYTDVLRGSMLIFCTNLTPGHCVKDNSRNNIEGSYPNECTMQQVEKSLDLPS